MKIKNYVLFLIAAFGLVVSSCNNIAESDDYDGVVSKTSTETTTIVTESEAEGALAYLAVAIDSLSANKTSARTVFPDFTDSAYAYEGFDKFVLYGWLGNSDSSSEKYQIAVWQSDDTLTAYKKLVGYTTTKTTTDEDTGETTTTTEGKDGDKYVPMRLFSKDAGASEAWTFELVASHHSGSDTTCTTFKGTTTKNIVAGGNNSLSFTLTRASNYNFSTDATAKGKVALTLDYKTGADTTLKLYKCNASTGAQSEEVTSTYFNSADSSFTVAAGKKKELNIASIPEGFYEVVLTFKNNGVDVGVLREFIYVLQSLTSKATLTVDVNADYTITYYYEILDNTLLGVDALTQVTYIDAEGKVALSSGVSFFKSDSTPVKYYSRLNAVTLPTPSDFVDDFNSGVGGEAVPAAAKYVFCGWYEDEGLQKGPILDIKANSTVGDKTYYAKFIDKREMPKVNSVAITGTQKVGNVLKATAKVDDADFAGTIFNWKWYYVTTSDSGTETKAEIKEEAGASISERNVSTAPLITTSSYTIRPKYAEKTLRAVAQQKYTVRKYDDTETKKDNKIIDSKPQDYVYDAGYVRTTYEASEYNAAGVYKVVENKYEYDAEAGTTATNEYEAAHADTSEIAKGDLEVTTADFKLGYTYTSNGSVIINSDLASSSLDKANAVWSAIHDKAATTYTLSGSNGTPTNDWFKGIDGNATTATLKLNGEVVDAESGNVTTAVKAPTSSKYLPVTLTIAGYEPLTLGSSDAEDAGYSNGAFIKVRFDKPASDDVLTALWKSGDAQDAEGLNVASGNDVLEGFDKDTISFKDSKYTHNYGTDETAVNVETSFLYKVETGSYVTAVGTRNAGKLGESSVLAETTDENGTVTYPSEVSVAGGKSLVFKTVAVAGEKDSKDNYVGAIDAAASESDPVTFRSTETTSNTNYIGTRISIASLRITVDSGSDAVTSAAVGHTIKIVPLDSTGAVISQYNDITWTLNRSGVTEAISGLKTAENADLTSRA